MGDLDLPQTIGAGMSDMLPAGLFVVANSVDIERLKSHPLTRGLGDSATLPLPADAALSKDVCRAARIVVLEVDPSSKLSLSRLDELRAERPQMPIIAAVQQTDVRLVRSLIRSGVTDVVVLPFDPEELTRGILEAIASAESQPDESGLAPMYVVARCTGGCGATTVVTHLAAQLAKLGADEKDVCVFDLDLQGGEVASFLGATSKATVSDLIEAGDEIDDDVVRDAVTRTQYDFVVLAAPEAITPLESIDADRLLAILRIARRNFSHILVDLPADWTDWSLSTALAASELVLVTDLSIASLRQANRRIELLSSIGVDRGKLKVVVNRMQRRLFKTIGVDEVEEVLGLPVVATLNDEGTNLRSAQNQGVLLSDVVGKSRFEKDVAGLANRLVHGVEG